MDKFNKICLGVATLSLISTAILGFITWQQQNYIESLHKLTVIKLKRSKSDTPYQYTLRSARKEISYLNDMIDKLDSQVSDLEDKVSSTEDSLGLVAHQVRKAQYDADIAQIDAWQAQRDADTAQIDAWQANDNTENLKDQLNNRFHSFY
ncbi:MAG: hypothetical protein J5477_02400 [Schwartzia sp.]|nr:hypothetical protein [Schwartzia sp. (in: firmicutes)]